MRAGCVAILLCDFQAGRQLGVVIARLSQVLNFGVQGFNFGRLIDAESNGPGERDGNEKFWVAVIDRRTVFETAVEESVARPTPAVVATVTAMPTGAA